MEVNEPDGSSPDKELVVPFTLIATDWLTHGNRYWLEFVNGRAAYSASESVVGQNLNYTAIRAVVQRHLTISKRVKPWFGVGLVVSRSSFSARHTKSNDGFLVQKFDDRSSNSLGLILNSTIDFQLEKKWYLGVKAEQTFSPSSGVNSLGAGVFLLHLL